MTAATCDHHACLNAAKAQQLLRERSQLTKGPVQEHSKTLAQRHSLAKRFLQGIILIPVLYELVVMAAEMTATCALSISWITAHSLRRQRCLCSKPFRHAELM
jgi:hypothetical protein